MATHIGMRVEGQATDGLPFHIIGGVLILDVAVRIGVKVEHGVSLTVVFTPAEGVCPQNLRSTLRLREGVAANPRLAVERIDVPVGKDLVLALISERRLQVS